MSSALALHLLLLLTITPRSAATLVYIVRVKDHAPLVSHPLAFNTKGKLNLRRGLLSATTLSTTSDGKSYSKSLHLDLVKVEALEEHRSVGSVEEDRRFNKATTYTPEFLGLAGGAWNVRKGSVQDAGRGTVVGVLDTGIDPSHPSFSPHGFKLPRRWRRACPPSSSFCNGKIVIARHFSKGIIAANAFNATYDLDSPFDGDGHGTHTSSIAVGNYGVPVNVSGYNYGLASGMAPQAWLAVYKVIYRDGGYISDVLAGIDQAIQDGVHILSISLGSTSSASGVPFLNLFDIALLFAVKAGALVVHAAGNNGPSPMTMNSFGPWLLSVGAATTDRSYANPVILGNRQEFIGSGLSGGTPGGRLYPLIYSKDAFIEQATSTFDTDYYSYCPDPQAFNKSIVKGKILICNFMQIFTGGAGAEINDAIATAKNLSAVGLLIISPDSEPSQQKSPVLDPSPYSIPATFITDPDASLIILDYYNANTERDEFKKVTHFGASAWIKDSRTPTFYAEAPEVAYFSSRGPVYANSATSMQSDVLKPDIIAPGHQIWGGWTPTGTDVSGYKGERFAMLSGTSMSAPHIAGIAALLKHKHQEWSNAAIRSALLTTASQINNRGHFIRAHQLSGNTSVSIRWASPFDYGSGFVNATAAMDPGLIFDVGFQDYVNFLCTVPGADASSVEEATGGICQNRPGDRSSDLNLPSITVGNLIGTRKVKRSVTSVSKREERYEAQVYAPKGVQVFVEPMMFTVRNEQRKTFTVTLKTIRANQAFTFGSIMWVGSKGHVVRMPVAVSAMFMSA
ncbi:hypothetical protein L7F22_058497 [Adiantum nelumboides]|nr:hypothetical protein [Adiantum nelumboides]